MHINARLFGSGSRGVAPSAIPPLTIIPELSQKNSRRLWRSQRRNPGAFPKAGPIFQQPSSLPEIAQTLAGIAFCAAGKLVNDFPAASKLVGKLFHQGISDSHSLLELSDFRVWSKGSFKKTNMSFRKSPFSRDFRERESLGCKSICGAGRPTFACKAPTLGFRLSGLPLLSLTFLVT